MKKNFTTPHDPLDDLLAAAVHGELTPAQRTELDSLLQNDPAARTAHQEIQTMHDLLERNHKEIRPDESFEDRMISAVRRKARSEKAHRETMWESAVVLWQALKRPLAVRPVWISAAVGMVCIALLIGFFYNRQHVRGVFATINQVQLAQSLTKSPVVVTAGDEKSAADEYKATPVPTVTTQNGLQARNDKVTEFPAQLAMPPAATPPVASDSAPQKDLRDVIKKQGLKYAETAQNGITLSGYVDTDYAYQFAGGASLAEGKSTAVSPVAKSPESNSVAVDTPTTPTAPSPSMNSAGNLPTDDSTGLSNGASGIASDEGSKSSTQSKASAATQDTRKLIRDAQLDLQVKSFQKTVDSITEFARSAGGYLDSSNSQRGGNGKLQGTVVVKIAPENLDAFLLKLRDLGEIKNQSVTTQDVTKDYIDTQASLANSQHMEAQLTLLLQHTNGKVSDLLQVERELERVRGEIEQMQGQLKLYDFQVQYATITINVAEKDLNKAAAYLLQEHDQFALFVHDVEDAFAQAKSAADTFKAEILNADLEHGADNTMSATLAFSVPPDQIDGFLNKVRSLGRVDNFTRTTQRVANDGGDADQPADDTRTEKDHVQVQLTIRADDESPRQQTQLAIASTGDIDTQAQALKDDAAKSGASIIAANFQRAPDGNETATMSFRLALSKVVDFMPLIEKLGRVESLTVQRNDRPDQAAADPNAPAQIDLTLHNVAAVSFENEPPRQATQLVVSSHDDVDAQSQQVKSDAIKAGIAVTGSTFERQPDGTEQAALTFRLPLAQSATFTAKLKELGKVESLAVQRNDVAGPNSTDPNAPAEISLSLHSEPAVVAENHGLWATIRDTTGGGLMAFFSSIATIGVLVAYVIPWVLLLTGVAWLGRRVYVAWSARKAV